MDQGLIPRRYAKALYKFALEKGAEKPLYTLMGQLVESFLERPEMNGVMNNPFISDADKTKLLLTAAGPEGAKSEVFKQFLQLLSNNRRLPLVRDIAVAYRDVYRKLNGIHRVTVTSAAPLEEETDKRLRALISKHLPQGHTMEYTNVVNPDLIGGFTIALDNERLDASLAGELKELERRLIIK